MNHRFLARLSTALVLGMLLLGTLVAPAAAATQTRWVDDNTGPGRCHGTNFHTIQDAIDASSPWDRVYVCPGNYQEQLTIDVRGLEVRSVPALGAKIWAPALDEPVDIAALVHVTARDVKFVGFRLKFWSGAIPVDPVRSGTAPDCSPYAVAIWADAPHTVIKANHIRAVGVNTLSGECGYEFGIVVADEAGSGSGGAWGADTSLVWRNFVRDFKYGGILVAGDRSARVLYNRVRYVHYDDPATCQLIPVVGVSPSLEPPCPEPPPGPVNGGIAASFGIAVEGALANVRGNSVYSTVDTSFFGAVPTFLVGGIVLAGATDGSKVRNNRVDNVFLGLGISDEDLFVPPLGLTKPPAAPGGVAVSGNRISETFFGLYVLGDDGYYWANRVHLSIVGAYVDEPASGNVFDRNDFRYNASIDCLDETTGGGTLGTANDWGDGVTSWNLGLSDAPDGICVPFFLAI